MRGSLLPTPSGADDACFLCGEGPSFARGLPLVLPGSFLLGKESSSAFGFDATPRSARMTPMPQGSARRAGLLRSAIHAQICGTQREVGQRARLSSRRGEGGARRIFR